MPPGGSEVLIKARLVQNITQEAASMAHALDTITKSATSMAQQMGAGAFAKLNAVTKEVTDAQGNMQRVLVGNIKVFGQAEAATKAQEAATKVATAALKQKEAAERKAAEAAAKHAQAVSTAQGAIKSTGADVGAINQRFGELGNRYVLTRDAAGQLTAKVKQASVTLDEQGNIVQKTNKSWIQYMAGVFGGIGLYTIASSALRTVRSAMNEVGAAAIGLNAMLETNRIAFTNFLGSAQAADAMLKELFQFAAVTPFEYPEVVEASKKIMAFGFAAEEVIPVLTAVGNATAGLGSGAVGIERITLALGQMAAKGKVQGQELRQLGEAGIRVQEVMKMVADQYGMSLSEIIALQEQGGLKAKDFIAAFMQYTKIKFGDQMMDQAKSFRGAMSTIKDITQMTIGQAFEPLFERLSEKAYDVAVFMQTKEFQQQAQAFQRTLAEIINTMSSFASGIAQNAVPILSALATLLGVKLVASIGALTIALAANPLGLLALAAAGLVFIFQKVRQEAERMRAEQEKGKASHQKMADALGDSGQAYLDLVDKQKRLEAQLNATDQSLNPQVYESLQSELAATGSQIDTMVGSLKQAETAWYAALTAEQKAQLAAGLYAREGKVFTDQMHLSAEAEKKLSDQHAANLEKLGPVNEAYRDTFKKLIDKMVEGGKISYDMGDALLKSMRTPKSPAEKLKDAIGLIGSKLGELDATTQTFIAKQLGDVFAKMKTGIIDDNEALKLMLPILAQVDAAAEAATAKKRWDDLGAAIAAAAGGQIFAGVDIQTKEIGELIPQSQIDEEKAKLKGLGAEWEIQAEKIRRAMGTSTEKNLNWTQPLKEGSAVLIDMQSDLDKIVQKQTEVNSKVAEWEAWNAAAGDRAAAGYEKAMVALGNFMAKQVLSKQLAGELSDKQAEALYKAYETVFGAALSNEDKLTLALTKSSKEFEGLGTAGQAAYGLIIAQAQKTFLQMGKTDAATEKATKNATIDSKMWATQIGMLQDTYKNLGPAAEPIIANIVQKALEAKDPYTELVRLVAEATKGFGELKKEVEGTGAGFTPAFAKGVEDKDFLEDQEEWAKDTRDKLAKDAEDAAETFIIAFTGKFKDETDRLAQAGQDSVAGVAAGMTSPTAQAILQTATATVAGWLPQWVKDLLGIKSPSTVFAAIGSQIPAGLAQGVNQGAQEPVAAVANLAQRLIDIIGNISVDPRVKDKVDIIRGVLDAFKTGLDALAGMGTYTGKGIENIGKAFSEMQEIIGRFGTLFSAGADYENMQKFGDAMRSILDGFKAGIDALVAMGDYVSPARERVDQFITDVLYITWRLASASTEVDTGMGDLMSSIGDGIGSMVEPLVAIGNYVGMARDAATGIAPALESFQQDFFGLIGRLSALADWLSHREGLAEKMKILGETIEPIMSPLKDAVDVLVGIGNRIPFSRVHGIAPALVSFQDDLFGLVGRLTNLADWITQQEDTVTQMKKLGEVLGAIFGPLKDAVDVLTSLSDYKGLARLVSRIAPALVAFQEDLQGLVGRLVSLANWLEREGRGTAIRRMGENLSPVFTALSDALSVLKDISELKSIQNLSTKFDWMEDFIRLLIDKVSIWAAIGSSTAITITKEMLAFAKSLSDVISPFQSVVSTASSLYDLADKQSKSTIAFAGVMALLAAATESMVEQLARWSDPRTDFAAIVERIKGFAANLGEVVSPFSIVVSAASTLYDLSEKAKDKLINTRELIMLLASITEGLVIQIAQWADPRTDFATIVEKIKTFSANLGAALSPIQTVANVVSSMIDLSDKLVKGMISWESMLVMLDTAVRKVLEQMQKWSTDADILAYLTSIMDAQEKAFVDNLTKALSPMQALFSVLSSAIDLTGKLGQNYVAWVSVGNELYSMLVNVLSMLSAWAQIDGLLNQITVIIGAQEGNFVTNLTKALSPLQALFSIISGAIDLTDRLAKGTLPAWVSIGTELWNALDNVLTMLSAWAQIDSLLSRILAIVGAQEGKFVDNLNRALSPMQSLFSLVTGAVDLTAKLAAGGVDWADVLDELNIGLRAVLGRLQSWATDTALLAQIAAVIEAQEGKFADNLTKALSPISAATGVVGNIIELSKKLADGVPDWMEATNNLRSALIGILEVWKTLATDAAFADSLIGYTKDFNTNLQNALAPISSAVGAVSSIMDFADKLADKTYNWALLAEKIKLALIDVMIYWKDLASGDFATWLASFPEDFSKNLQNALSPITTATGALNALVEWSDKLANKIHNWDGIVYQLAGYLYQVIARWVDLANSEEFKNNLAKFPKNFAEALNNAFGPIKTAIDALNAIKSYTGMLRGAANRIPTAVQALANDVAAFMEAFAEATKNIVVGDQIVKFGNALQAIIAPVKTYIDTFYWLWRYESIWARSGGRGRAQPAGFMPAQFEALANDIKLLVTRIADLMADPAMQRAVATAEELSDNLEPIMLFIKSSMDFMKDLLSYSKAGNKGNLQDFLDDFANAMTTLVSWFDVMNPMIQRLTSAIEGTGFFFGVSLIDAMILGLESRQSALATAILQLINRSLPAVGGLQPIPANMKVSMDPTVPTVTQGATSVNFNGPIYVSKLADIDAIAEKVSRVLGPKAYQTAKVVVQGN